MAAPKGNKFAQGLTDTGRPPIYENNDKGFEKYKSVVISFFDKCIENGTKATITGLALHMGFSSRGTLNEYAKKKEFSDITKRAMLTVENSYEISGTTFDMFALKNMGWKDHREVSNTNYDITPLTIEERDRFSQFSKELEDEY